MKVAYTHLYLYLPTAPDPLSVSLCRLPFPLTACVWFQSDTDGDSSPCACVWGCVLVRPGCAVWWCGGGVGVGWGQSVSQPFCLAWSPACVAAWMDGTQEGLYVLVGDETDREREKRECFVGRHSVYGIGSVGCYPSIYLSIYLCVCGYVCMYVCMLSTRYYPSVCLSVCPPEATHSRKSELFTVWVGGLRGSSPWPAAWLSGRLSGRLCVDRVCGGVVRLHGT